MTTGTSSAISGRLRSSAIPTSSSAPSSSGAGSARCATPEIDGCSGGRATPVKDCMAPASSARPRGTPSAANQTATVPAAVRSASVSRVRGLRDIGKA